MSDEQIELGTCDVRVGYIPGSVPHSKSDDCKNWKPLLDAAPAQPVPNDREKEFHDAVQRVGEYFNWDLPAFMASVKRDQETRNIAPCPVLTPEWDQEFPRDNRFHDPLKEAVLTQPSAEFYVDDTPPGERYFINKSLVSQVEFLRRRDVECAHKFDHHNICNNCGAERSVLPVSLREQIAIATIIEFAYKGDTLAIAEKFVTMRDALIDARLELTETRAALTPPFASWT